ncbi:elongation of very long chain fatty acids protein 4 isoform X1 [Drosophila subobscura]|uniref:elongation of very long chain fatty acids protein 4 isoform X1 n=1 Tax=Drosophila subobscura TaxID=7241 RepID=UPI00155AF4BD|nr:elongation of very long chain fatty acids protein 4 isoform X1 [Drosophila subobscura]
MSFNGSTKIGFPGIGSYPYPFAELADERTRTWPLVESPWNAAILLALYLLMVRYAPKWMARYKPLQLRGPLFCHNLAMALLNAHICLELFTASRALNYSISCQPCRVSHSPHEMRIAAAFWWFYISKILEFADTAFFILRQKWSQLSFLHVYHHSTMFAMCWIVVKWIPTGSSESHTTNLILLLSVSVCLHSLSACDDELLRAHHYVRLLRAECAGTPHPAVSLVEATLDCPAAGAVCHWPGLGLAGHYPEMRIPHLGQSHRRRLHADVSLPLWPFLCPKVQGSSGGSSSQAS